MRRVRLRSALTNALSLAPAPSLRRSGRPCGCLRIAHAATLAGPAGTPDGRSIRCRAASSRPPPDFGPARLKVSSGLGRRVAPGRSARCDVVSGPWRIRDLKVSQPPAGHEEQAAEDAQEEHRYPHRPTAGRDPRRPHGRRRPQADACRVERTYAAQLPRGPHCCGAMVVCVQCHAAPCTPIHAVHRSHGHEGRAVERSLGVGPGRELSSGHSTAPVRASSSGRNHGGWRPACRVR